MKNLLFIALQFGQSSSNDFTETLITYFFISVIIFLIGAFLTRLVFSISTFLKYQKAKTLLLIKIARKNGVSEKELDAILAITDPNIGEFTHLVNDKSITEIDKLKFEETKNQ